MLLRGIGANPSTRLAQIVCQLKPLDLLQLSRVSKDFRRQFGSRSSKALWAAVRKNAEEIPEPPPHISELKLASFLFEHSCYVRAYSPCSACTIVKTL